MDSKAIFDKLHAKRPSGQTYEVFSVDESCYFGKDKDNFVVFMIPSLMTRIAPVYQETRSLHFAFNKKCSFSHENIIETKVMHLLVCKEEDEDKVMAFIRLTKAFAQNDRDNDQYYLARLFSSISALFDKERKVSEIELQGLFAELYTIIYFSEKSCDLSRFWQSRNMMKFDFSISEKKRLEIKSTLKPSRTHHFKHDQLLSELYDIRIISFMLRKSDFGITLEDLIDTIREKYPDNYALLMHIETAIAYADKDMLRGIKYDELYLKDSMRCFDAKDIPHFNEKTPDGVFNAEYDCCLDNSTTVSEDFLINWVREG